MDVLRFVCFIGQLDLRFVCAAIFTDVVVSSINALRLNGPPYQVKQKNLIECNAFAGFPLVYKREF